MEYLWSFLVGGAICVAGQILMDTTTLTTPRILVIFVVSGVVLGAAGVYGPLEELAAAGATVPLPGFGYNLAKGALKGAEEGFVEVIAGPLEAAAAGIGAALAVGYIIALVFNPKSPKR